MAFAHTLQVHRSSALVVVLWLLNFNRLPDVLLLLVFFGSSSRCLGLVSVCDCAIS